MRAKGIYLLYRVLQTLAWPAVLFYFALRAIRSAQYRQSIRQRAGFLPAQFVQTVPGCFWLHAVSVGEIIASIELIRALRRESPNVPVFVSTSTTAGYAMAAEKLASSVTGVFYAPVDYVCTVRRVLRTLQPSVVIVLETEIWPNLFREARRTGAAVLIVNGRISDRTARRYASLRWFFGPALAQANRILARSEADRARFLAAGAPPAMVEDGGNLKYDFTPREAPADSPVRQFLAGHAGKRVWIAASTTADEQMVEEDSVLDAFEKLQDWVLILAPRKPERFAEVSERMAARHLSFVRRTGMDGKAASYPPILLLNTIGELAGLFALADVVFMGGSLADRGGHNILEPAFFGKPVITGPHLENFREIAADFRDHHAVITIDRPIDLAAAVEAAAEDREIGPRAQARAAARRGATAHAVRQIRELHSRALPVTRPTLLKRLLLTPFTWIWRRGGQMRAQKALNDFREIDARVISVGNITTGGTGKTPFVRWLARRLRDAGHRPGILTRGYGRRSHESLLAVPRGEQAPVSQTGDEAQLFLRDGTADLGVAADRYTVGMILRSRFESDILLLDDGFQHRRLRRDLDIVLIDALSPFGNCELVPLGRLREPMEALRRADAFVITRTEISLITQAIEHKLREYNPTAPVFRAETITDRWVDVAGGEEHRSSDLPPDRVVAFCGIGNPRAFWQVLSRLGFSPVECVEYSDHHSYTSAELKRLSQMARERGATALLTTEKDAVNLCEGAVALLEGIQLLWLKIDLRIENEAALMNLVAGKATTGTGD